MRTIGFCEIEPWCRAILAERWPGVPIYSDVRTLSGAQVGSADVICGGFPCQDISEAGKRVGIEGQRSGLWREMLRLVREVRPRWVVVENVRALRYRGYDRVRADLAAAGYACWPLVVAAIHVGAPQERARSWVVANADHARLQGAIRKRQSHAAGPERAASRREPVRPAGGHWPPGPGAVADIPRMADGPADRVDRLKALGNCVVPDIPEIIGRAILEAERMTP